MKNSGIALRRLLVAGASITDILKLLSSVEKPNKELESIITRLAKIVTKHQDGEAGYGHEMDIEGLTGIYKELNAMKEPPKEVVSAVKQLKALLGIDEEKEGSAPAGGNIPTFDMSIMKAATPGRPGVYKTRFIRAGQALDGKVWDADVLEAAVKAGLFEGIPLNVITYSGQYGPVDYHLSGDTDFVGQLVGNQVGFCQNALWDQNEKAIYGEVWVTDATRRALIDALIEQKNDPPGVSVYASGALSDKNVVTGIDEVHSLDLVTFPAADGAILAPALAASVSKWGKKEFARLGAAEGEQAPFGANEEPPVEEQRASTGESFTDTEPYGWSWLESRAAQIVDDYLREGKGSWSDTLKQKFNTLLEALKQYEYDKKEYPVDLMCELPRMVSEIVREAKREEGETQEPEDTDQNSTERSEQNSQSVEGGMKGMLKERVSINKLMASTLQKAMAGVNERLSSIEERVGVVDTEAMISEKLTASDLPIEAQAVIRDALTGAIVSPQAVDRLIAYQRKTLQLLDAGLREKAAITISGEMLDQQHGDSVQDDINKILGME